MRGSGVPEISLDDLAIELFSSSDFGDRGRSSEVSSANDTAACRRRGRSVSRRGSSIAELRNLSEKNNNNSNGNGNGVSDGSSRRRRSLSVAPCRMSDTENEHSNKNSSHANLRDLRVWNKEKPSLQKPTASNQQRGLRRCSSQKDLLRSHDGYSSYSSTLTDDESNDARHNANGVEKAAHAAYAHTKSEKRKQELLAEIMLEEERGKELKKVVGELRCNSKETAASKRPTRGRKRSNDRNRSSKQLAEEADKIIEDFISSVEETDFSSFDGERSDTSSVLGGTIKKITQYGDFEAFKSSLRSDLLPWEMDGVVLPWLKWETSNDVTPLLRSDNKQCPETPKTVLRDAMEEASAGPEQERSVNSKSSRGSWSPGVVNSFSNLDMGEISRAGDVDSCKNHLLSLVPRRPRVDIDDYLKPPSNENFLSEKWRQRERINSGGLLICHSGSLGKFFL